MIRNPQIALIDGVCILYGRCEDAKGFAFYASENGRFLLVQYSESYDGTPASTSSMCACA